ncbi:hypothetical protein [Bacillus sp. SA1-12]|uniref:hypothetical protein n=1 Tax=Bacillus sp. SA1-12 TaxID=1455638 RepID=UPI000695C28C|nr:hypothetical protein [Bacillus sp. SA1-12]
MKNSFFTCMLFAVFMTISACGYAAEQDNERINEDNKQVEENKGQDEGSETEQAEREEGNQEDQSEADPQETILEKSEEVLQALKEKNRDKLASYIHKEKGVLFSPYIFVEDKAITFDSEKMKGFFQDTQTYTWGIQDGSGEPIELKPSDYYEKYIYNDQFDQADEVVFDPKVPRGNMKRNLAEVFPGSHTVEYYIKGTEENGNMDWKALNLVFEQDKDGEWVIVGIVHDQWTI